MDELNRDVAGLRCRDVLGHLSAYMDGDLTAEEVGRVEAHLRGCDRCERFGGRFVGIVSALRRELGEVEELASDVAERLRTRLHSA